MITHDVDEAILLADRVLLMTNGPFAQVAESVTIDIPRPRRRADIIHHDGYYKIRNHLVEFLAKRSKDLASGSEALEETNNGPHKPKIVRPAFSTPSSSETESIVPPNLMKIKG